MRVPRFYQTEAMEAFFNALNVPDTHPLIGMPTGSGKSLTIAMICRRAIAMFPGVRITISTSTKELIQQDLDAIHSIWQDAPVGIYSDSYGSKDASQQITLTTIQSAAKNPEAFGKQNFMLVDEAQLVSPTEETQYQRFIKAMLVKNKNFRVGGLSATLYRSKGGYLIDHGLFNRVCYDITGAKAFEALINMGFLVPLHSRPTNFFYDMTGVKTSGVDFNEKELQKIVNVKEKNETALAEALEIGKDLNHWIIFCGGIDHINDVVEILNDWGHYAVAVHSDMSDDERDHNVKMFKTGNCRFIVSDAILTTGFDAPFIDHIVILRPTKAVVRHVQSLGRGTRPVYAVGYDLETVEGRLAAIAASGRLFCRISDFGRNLERLGPINDPLVPGKKLGKGEMPIKFCTTDKLMRGYPRGPLVGCGAYNYCAARFCIECHEEFLWDDQPKIGKTASEAPATRLAKIMAEWVPVTGVDYEPLYRALKPPAMRVIYKSGLNRYSQLISMESEHPYARHMAGIWWDARVMVRPMNTLHGLTMTHLIPKPSFVLVQLNLPHPKVVQISYSETKPELDDYDAKTTEE